MYACNLRSCKALLHIRLNVRSSHVTYQLAFVPQYLLGTRSARCLHPLCFSFRRAPLQNAVFRVFYAVLFLSVRFSPWYYLYWWTRVNSNCCDTYFMYRNIIITQTWTTCVCSVVRHDAITCRVIFGTLCLNILISVIFVYSLHFWVSCEYQ